MVETEFNPACKECQARAEAEMRRRAEHDKGAKDALEDRGCRPTSSVYIAGYRYGNKIKKIRREE